MIHLKTFFVGLAIFLAPCFLYSQGSRVIPFFVQPGNGQVVFIQWKMAPENDTLPFEIERSQDTIKWERIFKAGIESSHEYFFTDTVTGKGVFYYRIKQTDNEGNRSYSMTRWVQISSTGQLYIWPNPANDVLHIRTAFAKGSLEIFDTEGRLIVKKSITDYTTDLPLRQLKKGLYFIRVKHDKEILAEKFVKE